METDVEIQCPECGTFYMSPREFLGDIGTCQGCGIRFKVLEYKRKPMHRNWFINLLCRLFGVE